jgi:HEAT repeat protein
MERRDLPRVPKRLERLLPGPTAVARLENGHALVADWSEANALDEYVAEEVESVSRWSLPASKTPPVTLEPLSANRVLVGYADGRIVEVARGGVLWQGTGPVLPIKLRSGHLLGRARETSGHVIETKATGEIVWQAIVVGVVTRVRPCLNLVSFGFAPVRVKDVWSDIYVKQVKATRSQNPRVREKAMRDLTQAKEDAIQAIPFLIELLNDPDRLNRKIAWACLRDVAALPALIEALDDKEVNRRLGSMKALCSLEAAAKPAVPALIRLLTDPEAEVREQAAVTLGAIGPEARAAVPALIRALRDKSTDVRWSAADALARMGPAAKEATPHLLVALKGDDHRLRAMAASALSQIKGNTREIVEALTARLTADDTPDTRTWVACALGHFGEAAAPALPRLIPLLQTKEGLNEEQRRMLHGAAATAIGAIGPTAKSAIPDLMKLLQDKSEDEEARCSAVGAIGKMGEAAKGTVPELEGIVRDIRQQPEALRRAATEALRNINKTSK